MFSGFVCQQSDNVGRLGADKSLFSDLWLSNWVWFNCFLFVTCFLSHRQMFLLTDEYTTSTQRWNIHLQRSVLDKFKPRTELLIKYSNFLLSILLVIRCPNWASIPFSEHRNHDNSSWRYMYGLNKTNWKLLETFLTDKSNLKSPFNMVTTYDSYRAVFLMPVFFSKIETKRNWWHFWTRQLVKSPNLVSWMLIISK